MVKRVRACGAVIRGDTILMVQHVHDGRDYWTLPGGRIEPGESAAAAAEREVLEETGLALTALGELFSSTSDAGVTTHCYLMSDSDGEPSLGGDPEQAHLAPEERMLRAVAWRPLAGLGDDVQVRDVIRVLGLSV